MGRIFGHLAAAGRKSGFTIAGKVLFANCAIVAVGAFSGTWVAQQYADESSFVLGAILFTGGLLVSLPVNYLAVKAALKPLRRLDAAMAQVQEGSLCSSIDLGGNADPQINRLKASFNTMTEWLRCDRETIERLSLVDPLTEVGNTRALSQGLETEIARIDRYGHAMPAAFSVLIIDVDNFKQINDTFGHLAGDAVLRDMADLLQSSLRKTDTTLSALKHFRFGGDEFVIIAPHTSAKGAKILADRLDEKIRCYRFRTHDGKELDLTRIGQVRASIGYASYPEEAASSEELLDLADQRMYDIKEGRSERRLRRLRPTRYFPETLPAAGPCQD